MMGDIINKYKENFELALATLTKSNNTNELLVEQMKELHRIIRQYESITKQLMARNDLCTEMLHTSRDAWATLLQAYEAQTDILVNGANNQNTKEHKRASDRYDIVAKEYKALYDLFIKEWDQHPDRINVSMLSSSNKSSDT